MSEAYTAPYRVSMRALPSVTPNFNSATDAAAIDTRRHGVENINLHLTIYPVKLKQLCRI